MFGALADRLAASLERGKELKRLIKWLYSSRNGVAMSKNDLINLRAIEKIVEGEMTYKTDNQPLNEATYRTPGTVIADLREQLTEKDKEIERLTNPGRTQFCRMCQDYAEQIERLKAERLEPIDEAIKRIDFPATVPTCGYLNEYEKGYADGRLDVVDVLKQIRAKYQGEE